MALDREDLLAAALEYAALGYAVFPCVPGAKHPITQRGFKDATTDPAQIETWWREWPKANIATPTQGLLVIDQEGPSPCWPLDNESKRLDLAKAPTAVTPSGGVHSYFRQPPDKSWPSSVKKLGDNVDTRANGGYVLLPPSSVADRPYLWQPTLELDVRPEHLPLPPAWLVEQLDSLCEAKSAPSSSNANTIPEGQRNTALASLAGTMRRVGMSEPEILAALTQANADRCKPPLQDREVAKIAQSVARYEPDPVSVAAAENHFAQDFEATEPAGPQDPGPIPEELLRVPGFVSELMDYCLQTAPYPNVTLAFCGALALQAFLAGRRVRDPGDNRTNLYLLGLAHSSAGKDWPRKINTQILHQVGQAGALGERFASGEGIQDAMFVTPCMLFQTDEIDGILQSINKSKDARHENILGTLLTMYSSASTVYPMRRKASNEAPGAIDQPCLVIFGTAIPNHYYEALSERMLTNGFFARMLILESGKRGKGQEPKILAVPARVLATAKHWAELKPGAGNMADWHPQPKVVEQSADARAILSEAREVAEAEYAKAETRNDAVATTVWGRMSEQSRKLALIHAVSENPASPLIGKAAAQWATAFVDHQIRRMLFMASEHVFENEFDGKCKRFLAVLRKYQTRKGNDWMPYWELSRALPWTAREFDEVRIALENQRKILFEDQKTGGPPKRLFRLMPTH